MRAFTHSREHASHVCEIVNKIKPINGNVSRSIPLTEVSLMKYSRPEYCAYHDRATCLMKILMKIHIYLCILRDGKEERRIKEK